MKVLLLNGVNQKEDYSNQIYQIINHHLKTTNHQVKSYDLHQLDIAPCMGCFGCWFQTPGECMIDDDGRLVARELIQNDVVIYFSPVTFGGYSCQLKKAMDRFIPDIMPFFRIMQHEIHHVPRYKKYPNLIFIGTLPGENPDMEETFFQLNHRNALNMNPKLYSQAIFYPQQTEEEIQSKFTELMKDVERI